SGRNGLSTSSRTLVPWNFRESISTSEVFPTPIGPSMARWRSLMSPSVGIGTAQILIRPRRGASGLEAGEGASGIEQLERGSGEPVRGRRAQRLEERLLLFRQVFGAGHQRHAEGIEP